MPIPYGDPTGQGAGVEQPAPVSPYPSSGTAPDETAAPDAVQKALELVKLTVYRAVKLQPAYAEKFAAAVNNAIQQAKMETQNESPKATAAPGAAGESGAVMGGAPARQRPDMASMFR